MLLGANGNEMVSSLQLEPAWFSVVGLAIDIIAIILLAWELLIRRSTSLRPTGDLDDPTVSRVRKRIREEKMTVLCVLLLVIGFGLQMYGSWPG